MHVSSFQGYPMWCALDDGHDGRHMHMDTPKVGERVWNPNRSEHGTVTEVQGNGAKFRVQWQTGPLSWHSLNTIKPSTGALIEAKRVHRKDEQRRKGTVV